MIATALAQGRAARRARTRALAGGRRRRGRAVGRRLRSFGVDTRRLLPTDAAHDHRSGPGGSRTRKEALRGARPPRAGTPRARLRSDARPTVPCCGGRPFPRAGAARGARARARGVPVVADFHRPSPQVLPCFRTWTSRWCRGSSRSSGCRAPGRRHADATAEEYGATPVVTPARRAASGSTARAGGASARRACA